MQGDTVAMTSIEPFPSHRRDAVRIIYGLEQDSIRADPQPVRSARYS